MLEAIRQLKEQNINHADIQFIITVGEESGLIGAKALDTSLLKADYGYALDSDGDVGNIIVAAPTQAKIKAVIKGKTAHAGVAPKKGFLLLRLPPRRFPRCRWDESTKKLQQISAGLKAAPRPMYATKSIFWQKHVRL